MNFGNWDLRNFGNVLGIRTLAAALVLLSLTVGCTKKKEKQEVWVYTSLYKDTIADISPKLEAALPDIKVNFFQAGSEEVAAKVNSELASKNLQADVLISSDRFWYEEMAQSGNLHVYTSPESTGVPETLKNPAGFYSTLSIPVMVMVYNSDSVPANSAPKSFKELAEPKWKNKVATGSPLASGTTFTTVAMWKDKYGWEYLQGLRKNEVIFQGGNSAVMSRVQNNERPVGVALLENILRFQDKDKRLKIVYPTDGVVLQSNVIAITKKSTSREAAQKVVDWMYGKDGQEAMVRSFMYSPLNKYEPPFGAPKFSDLQSNSFIWSKEFIDNTVKTRTEIKEKFAEIMYQ